MTRRTRRFFSSLVLLAVFVGVPILLTWRAVRQERLDRALIAALKQRKADTVVSLLKQGADPNTREHSGGTVSFRQIFRSLFLRLRHGNQPAQQEGNTSLILALNTTEAGDEKSRIHVEPRTVVALLDAGADPNCREKVSPHWTPLLYAIDFCPSQVQHFLEKGADVNAKTDDGLTPLMEAEDPAVTRLLLERGADVNARDNDGASVLVNNCSDDSLETLRLLLD